MNAAIAVGERDAQSIGVRQAQAHIAIHEFELVVVAVDHHGAACVPPFILEPQCRCDQPIE